MPEGDTVWHTAAVLRAALVGKSLTRCDIRVPRYATVDLSGHQVDEVLSYGKHLFIRVGPASIHAHLKMEGRFRVDRFPVDGCPADHRTRIILEAGAVRVIGADLGILQILDREHDMAVVAHLGPDLLGDGWSPDLVVANLTADPERPLATALLDQRVVAGIGNVYANELCFITGHLPWAPVRDVRDPRRLANRARDMLRTNRSRWNRTTTGETRPGHRLWVYGRATLPCRRCGTLIVTDRDGDRISFWCPSCQR